VVVVSVVVHIMQENVLNGLQEIPLLLVDQLKVVGLAVQVEQLLHVLSQIGLLIGEYLLGLNNSKLVQSEKQFKNTLRRKLMLLTLKQW
jgi:hypothetical protein